MMVGTKNDLNTDFSVVCIAHTGVDRVKVLDVSKQRYWEPERNVLVKENSVSNQP